MSVVHRGRLLGVLATGLLAVSQGVAASAQVAPVQEFTGSLADGSRNATKTHEITLEAGKLYAITLDSSDFDPQLIVSQGGAELAKDDDGGEGMNALIEFKPVTSGIFQAKVERVNNESGDYVLRVREQPPLPAPQRPTATGTSTFEMTHYSSRLNAQSPTYSSRPLEDFLITLNANKRVMIFMDKKSGDIDPLVEVYLASDPDGPPVASDDDSGGARNALISFVPAETEDYIVRATSANSSGYGSYSLRVGQEP